MQFHHVALYVKDINVSSNFYQKIFNFTVKQAFHTKDNHYGIVHLWQNNRFILELIEQNINFQYHPIHLGFSTQNLDAIIEKLSTWNMKPLRGPLHIGQERIIFIADPDGYELEINQGIA